MTVIERSHVEQFRAVITRHLGLHFDDTKLDHLADVLRHRLNAVGTSGFEAYIESLTHASVGSDELRALAELLTIGETFFFRNADHFRAFAETVLPARIRACSQEKRLRILSLGCSSGEEPYSLATVVREALPDLADWDVQIIGVDINPAMLKKSTKARYAAWSLRATPDEAKHRYFRADGRDFVLDPAIRAMVRFEERNLVAGDPLSWLSGRCDVVFCRNVIMYFTPEVMRTVIHGISQALVPGGFLFLGHAETLRGLSQEFHLCHTHETFYYQRRDTPDPPVAVPAPQRQLAETLPDAVVSTTSWVEAIRQASERIESLVDAGDRRVHTTPGRSGGGVTPGTRAWDLGIVLAAMRQERFLEALALLQGLPADAHDEPDALLLLAVLLTNCGRLDEAEAVCTRLCDLDGLSAGAHYVMALCREHAGDPAGAIEQDQTAIYLDAGFAMPHLHLGLMARRSGDAVTAQRELGQALMLLAREDAARLLMFGGGFSRETLVQVCQAELRAAGRAG